MYFLDFWRSIWCYCLCQVCQSIKLRDSEFTWYKYKCSAASMLPVLAASLASMVANVSQGHSISSDIIHIIIKHRNGSKDFSHTSQWLVWKLQNIVWSLACTPVSILLCLHSSVQCAFPGFRHWWHCWNSCTNDTHNQRTSWYIEQRRFVVHSLT